MKKMSFSIITALVLSLKSANGAGIPVVDAASIAESVKQYSQMLKEYNQMLKDTMNFEKQMAELGVGMNNVSDILGNLNSMVRDMQNIYDNVANIPQDFLGNIAQIQRACSFLRTQSLYFRNKINSFSNVITNDFNRCTSGLKNNAELSKSIDELFTKIDNTNDDKLKEQYYTEIDNIRNAQKFLQQKENEERANRIVAFYDTFHKKDKNNPYTKEKMNEDLKALAKALNKANNQKQAQALSNAILIKILEMMQRQYELNIEYSNAMVNLSNLSNLTNKTSLNEQSFQNSYKEQKIEDRFLIYKDAPAYQSDKNGLPIFTIK